MTVICCGWIGAWTWIHHHFNFNSISTTTFVDQADSENDQLKSLVTARLKPYWFWWYSTVAEALDPPRIEGWNIHVGYIVQDVSWSSYYCGCGYLGAYTHHHSNSKLAPLLLLAQVLEVLSWNLWSLLSSKPYWYTVAETLLEPTQNHVVAIFWQLLFSSWIQYLNSTASSAIALLLLPLCCFASCTSQKPKVDL